MSRMPLCIVLGLLASCENAEDTKAVVSRFREATQAYCACTDDACRDAIKAELETWKQANAKKIESMGEQGTLAVAEEMVAQTKCLADAPIDRSASSQVIEPDAIDDPRLQAIAQGIQELEQQQAELEAEQKTLSESARDSERLRLEAERARLEAKIAEDEQR